MNFLNLNWKTLHSRYDPCIKHLMKTVPYVIKSMNFTDDNIDEVMKNDRMKRRDMPYFYDTGNLIQLTSVHTHPEGFSCYLTYVSWCYSRCYIEPRVRYVESEFCFGIALDYTYNPRTLKKVLHVRRGAKSFVESIPRYFVQALEEKSRRVILHPDA